MALGTWALVAGLALATLLVGDAAVDGAAPRLIGRDPTKHLVLDGRVIAKVQGARLVLGTVAKDSRNPLFMADKPWENALNNLYPNVLYDSRERLFKLWYKCVLSDPDVIRQMENPTTLHGQGWYLLYATSRDGIHWTKPELGLYRFAGSTRNNAVARDTPDVGVFKDGHDSDPSRRYKMVYDLARGQMRVRFSPDGIHWSEPVVPEGLTERTGDTHNNAFWDERLGRYVLITRFFEGQRKVACAESRDFVHWDPPQLVLQSLPTEGVGRQTYCMPVFPYGNCYLGYVMMFNAGSDQTVDCELVWSPDTVEWNRVCAGTSLIPRGPAGSCDSACIYAPSGPAIAIGDRLQIYYGGSDYPHRGWKRHCLPCLATLRVDGFAGYRPEDGASPAVVIARPMRATGAPIRVSADAEGGSLLVSALDQDGALLAGPAEITRDVTDSPVPWRTRTRSLSAGRIIQLRFELCRATLYSFSGLEALPGAAPR